MSGQSEQDFTLGYAINLYSHLNLIAATTKHAESRDQADKVPVYINVSSLAVYGGDKATPASKVIPEWVTKVCNITTDANDPTSQGHTVDPRDELRSLQERRRNDRLRPCSERQVSFNETTTTPS